MSQNAFNIVLISQLLKKKKNTLHSAYKAVNKSIFNYLCLSIFLLLFNFSPQNHRDSIILINVQLDNVVLGDEAVDSLFLEQTNISPGYNVGKLVGHCLVIARK